MTYDGLFCSLSHVVHALSHELSGIYSGFSSRDTETQRGGRVQDLSHTTGGSRVQASMCAGSRPGLMATMLCFFPVEDTETRHSEDRSRVTLEHKEGSHHFL